MENFQIIPTIATVEKFFMVDENVFFPESDVIRAQMTLTGE
jgi:hypothetical protein